MAPGSAGIGSTTRDASGIGSTTASGSTEGHVLVSRKPSAPAPPAAETPVPAAGERSAPPLHLPVRPLLLQRRVEPAIDPGAHRGSSRMSGAGAPTAPSASPVRAVVLPPEPPPGTPGANSSAASADVMAHTLGGSSPRGGDETVQLVPAERAGTATVGNSSPPTAAASGRSPAAWGARALSTPPAALPAALTAALPAVQRAEASSPSFQPASADRARIAQVLATTSARVAEEDAGSAAVQRALEAEPAGAAPPPAAGVAASGSASSGGATAAPGIADQPQQLEHLLDRLYAPLVRRLKAEMLLDRERRGVRIDRI
ncbi:hypothetical protein EV279_2611 [Microbacterium sp. BK668]|nr:hypothetical protein EV279_2611 [Microbacterium sp. BK668]